MITIKNLCFASVLCLILFICSGAALADSITINEDETHSTKRGGALPYMFTTETLGTGLGIGGIISGIYEPQSSLMATVFVTDNDSWLIAGGLNNLRFDSLDRWFFDIYVQDSHYTDQRFYDSAHRSTTDSAGFNDSSEDDYVFGISDDIHLELTARYPLPIGVAKNEPLTTYKTRDGLLVSEPQGGGEWNPLTSGKTTLRFRYFYRYRNLQQIEQEDLLSSSTNGMEVRLDYDNTDFLPNPSRGSRQKIIITRDFGWFNSSASWTNIELDASKYFDLGTSHWFRHQVLAMNFWTSYTPSWDLDQDTGRINHRPPPGYGAFLGGFDRLRAFPTSRFQDKSAVYYGMELRLIPKINALNTWPLLKHFEIDWWQLATFVEAGRVGPDYDADLFTKDLKWNLGLSFRVMAFQQPLRLDWAVSEEDYAIWAMYSQPFSR